MLVSEFQLNASHKEETEGTHVTVYLPKEAATDAAHPELFDKIA